MSTYARIQNGVVMELFTPPRGVSFTECFHPDIAALFVEVTNASPLPSPGWTATEAAGAWTFAAPPTPVSSLAAQAQAMLAAGIQVVFARNPALNGTYACDPTTYQRMAGIVAAIAGGLGLPGGGNTFNWPDVNGTLHAFTADEFKALCAAVMDFEYTLNAISATNQGTLPKQPVHIA